MYKIVFFAMFVTLSLGWCGFLLAGTSSDISPSIVYDLSPLRQALGISDIVSVGCSNAVQTVLDNSGDGGTSMKLGGIGLLNDGQMAGSEWLVTGPGILSFDWKVSSEADYDWLLFYEAGSSSSNKISGTVDWSHMSVTVLGATDLPHTFRWEYEKDPVGDYVGQDCGWVDAIKWTPFFILNIQNGTGDGYYTNKTSVAITADAPSVYHEFDRWTGDTNAVANIFAALTSVLISNSNIAITATYKDSLYPVVVNNGNGDGSYTNNATIAIYADAPPAHFAFDRWTGATNTVANIFSANTTLFVPGVSVTVTATYKPIYYSVVVNNGTGDGSYTNKTTVAINADAPMAHFTFDKWIGDTNGVLNVFAPITTLKVPGVSVTVTATYKDILYPVTITGGQGGGSYSYGSIIELIAIIPEGKRFYQWGDMTNHVADVNAATTTLFVAGETVSVLARYSVPLTVNSGSGSGWYPEGGAVTVTANSDPLYKGFSEWVGSAADYASNRYARSTAVTIPTFPSELDATYRYSVARTVGCWGRTFTEDGTSGGVSGDASAGSPSGTPAVKLGGAGVIPDNGFAAFETVVSGSGSILFQWKVSSESNADYLKFRVDGGEVAAISGTKGPWTQVSNRVNTAGSHVLRWEYVKNVSNASSTDAGWVDDIVWVGDVPTPSLTPVIVQATLTNQNMAIQFTGERGVTYVVQTNGDLNPAGWGDYQPMQPIWINESNGLHRFEVAPSLDGQGKFFYRIITPR